MKKPTKFICEYCTKPFERMVYPSSKGALLFCSPTCRNKARIRPMIPCPICGKMFKDVLFDGIRKKTCSVKCSSILRIGRTSPKRTPQKTIDMIADMYKTKTASQIAGELSMGVGQVKNIISRWIGWTLPPEEVKRRAILANRERMLTNNPMFNKETVQKVEDYYTNNPEDAKSRIERIQEGARRWQHSNPTSLEIKLFDILDSYGVSFERHPIIKKNFVVDCRIGTLIIQADGDYWHGHKRFEPLTERQKAQQRRDNAQDKYLSTCGYRIARIWGSDMSSECVHRVLKESLII